MNLNNKSKQLQLILGLQKVLNNNIDIINSLTKGYVLDITELVESRKSIKLTEWLYDNNIIYRMVIGEVQPTGFVEIDSIIEDILTERVLLKLKNKEDFVTIKLKWLGK